MYKISEFSKMTGLTVKALRYYDAQALLVPSLRDNETSYRFYLDDDIKRALLIKTLRSLDFSISEIRDILSNCETEEDLSYCLLEKQEMIKRNILAEKEQLKKIESFLKPLTGSPMAAEYVIEIKEIKAVNVLSIRFQGKYKELGRYVPLLYKAAKDACSGRHFSCYYTEGCTDWADIELCLPVKRPVICADAVYKTIPGITAVSARHFGSYETLYRAYKALFQYANNESLRLSLPAREVYVKGPGKLFYGNPDKYITDILMPFKS